MFGLPGSGRISAVHEGLRNGLVGLGVLEQDVDEELPDPPDVLLRDKDGRVGLEDVDLSLIVVGWVSLGWLGNIESA